MLSLLPALAISALMVGCAAQKPVTRPAEPAVPSHWRSVPDTRPRDTAALAEWWRQFRDPVLDALVADALAANPDMNSAQAQLREARARRDVSAAALGVTVTGSATAGRAKSSRESGGGTTRNNFQAGFDASWEPDVFGGLRRGLEASEADLDASLENLRDVRVSLVAEVARNYVELRTGERRLAIAERNLATLEETHDLTRWRHQAGLATELDEAQARTQVEQTRAALPALRTAIVEARHRLAILLGRAPDEMDARLGQAGDIPDADDRVSMGIPAETLRQRPDVRAAERQVAAQAARLAEAEAARFPSFSLGGSLGLQSLAVNRLLSSDAGTASLLAGITAPLFDAGRIRGNIAIQDALLEQAVEGYRAAILNALGDVENALAALANGRARQAELGRATASSRTAHRIALDRYAAGLIDFQSVLDSQRTLLGLEDQLVSGTGEQTTALIQLYKAMGGGWTPEATPAPVKDPP